MDLPINWLLYWKLLEFIFKQALERYVFGFDRHDIDDGFPSAHHLYDFEAEQIPVVVQKLLHLSIFQGHFVGMGHFDVDEGIIIADVFDFI